MRKNIVSAAALGTAAAMTVGISAQAASRPAVVTGGGHSCSYTTTEYMLTDDNMNVRLHPGSTAFTAAWTPGHRHAWEDAYWVTGFHDENSSICDKRELPGTHGKYGASYRLPISFTARTRITADLRVTGSGRLGFDIWFTADPRETTPTEMEHDPRTREILLQPGRGGIYRDNPGWHRVFFGALRSSGNGVNVRGVNLTVLARQAGVPLGMNWQAIDAGGETPFGTFTVTSYALHISDQASPKPVRHHHKLVHHKPVRHHKPVHHKPVHHKRSAAEIRRAHLAHLRWLKRHHH